MTAQLTGPTAAAPLADSPRRRGETAPRWFELITLTGVLALAFVGSIGLLLAIIGHFTTVLSLCLGLPLTALAVFGLYRWLPPGGTSRGAKIGALAALGIAVTYAVLAGATPSQNVLVSRDPGSYQATARQLAREGALEIDARGQAFDGVRGLRFAGAAVYDMGGPYPATDVPGEPGEVRQSGLIEPQFNHLASVALAVGFDVGGYQLMFRMPALMAALGLLALYAVTARATRRPLVSLLAPAVFAACLPLLYIARNTYSESFALVLLWGSILIMIGLHRRPRVIAGAIGGVVLGALICDRVDALLYACMVFPLAAVSMAVARNGAVFAARARAWLAVVTATVIVGAIGWNDLSERSGLYVTDLGPQLKLLRAALIASAVVSAAGLIVWRTAPPVRRLAHRISGPAAIVAGIAVGGALLFGWLVRPLVQTAERAQILSIVVEIQKADGLAAEPHRSYAEHSLWWMSWYLGAPALLAAIGGLSWGVWRTIRSGTNPAVVALLVLCLGGGALYWYDPQITPDQLWASRRFVPAALPALAVWAAIGVGALASTRWVKRFGPVARGGAIGVLTVVLLVPPLLTTAPLRWQRMQPGYLDPILQTCEQVGPNAAIIVLGGYGGVTLPQTLRGWCGVPVAAEGSAVTREKLPALAAQIKANGYQLYLVSPDVGNLKGYQVPGGPVPQSTVGVPQPWLVESTLDRPPSKYVDPAAALPVPTPFALHSLQVQTPP